MIQSIKGHSPKIHKKAFVHERATIIGQVIIEEGASIWPGAVLRGDMGLIKIGKNTSIQDGVMIHMTEGFSQSIVGNNVTVGHGAIIHGAAIEDNCLVGMGSILLDQAQLSSYCFVAAGSLVTGRKKFAEGSFICGSPAKILRPIKDEEKNIIDSSVVHYLEVQKLYTSSFLAK